MDASDVEALRTADAERLEQQEAVLMEFVRRATLEPTTITDEEFQQLREVGFSDEEIMEATFAMALSTAETRFCDALGFVPTRK